MNKTTHASSPHHVKRSEIFDYQTYEEHRGDTKSKIFEIKKHRRVHLGENLTFLFENHETIKYQIQEIMRVEKIVKESAILEELNTYNSFLGNSGELACVLLIEIEEESDRKPLLENWMGMEKCIYILDEVGNKIFAEHDPTQVGDRRLSAVQYLKFVIKEPPIAIGCTFDELAGETELTKEQRNALAEDLSATLA
ncbi:MAG: hypothetical protein CL881_06655 [Dehalococcoidia bacterium]|nr:hypothetical protein [Dehalococcoidia bacterium]|tara:strand:- start:2766 stop:3353 length:588 start_codon:yes stop_codon:yes gene_type:complete